MAELGRVLACLTAMLVTGAAVSTLQERPVDPAAGLEAFVHAERSEQKLPGLAAVVVRSDGAPRVYVSGERRIGKGDLMTTADRMHSNNPNTVSPRAICLHVIGAAHRYAHYIRKARGVDFIERYEASPAQLRSPQDVRGLLTEGILLTEESVEPLLNATDQEIQALSFTVRWGPRYDPEMILEHAVCHLLRHRRQLERW